MKKYSKSILIKAPPDKVFAYMDDISHTGMHMTKSSGAMMGTKLELQQISENAAGPRAKYRWYGKVMGFNMDFTVIVSQWIQDNEKIWETTGPAKMIILKWYQMHLVLKPYGLDTNVELSIIYTLPDNIFLMIIAFFLAPLYARWCINNMLNDSRKMLEKKMSEIPS